MKPPVFLDRDGVINLNRSDYVKNLDEFVPIDGAVESIAKLAVAGHPVVVVTNQSCIGRGLCREEDVRAIHEHLRKIVALAGGIIDGIYYCPHHPDEGCNCRKPGTGLVERASSELSLVPGGYIVGDAQTDMELGFRTGLKTIMVRTGRGESQLNHIVFEGLTMPWKTVASITEAVDLIIDTENAGEGNG